MKNLPKTIYLQIGEDCKINADFNQMRKINKITWNNKRINKNDIEFVLADNEKQEEWCVINGIGLRKDLCNEDCDKNTCKNIIKNS